MLADRCNDSLSTSNSGGSRHSLSKRSCLWIQNEQAWPSMGRHCAWRRPQKAGRKFLPKLLPSFRRGSSLGKHCLLFGVEGNPKLRLWKALAISFMTLSFSTLPASSSLDSLDSWTQRSDFQWLPRGEFFSIKLSVRGAYTWYETKKKKTTTEGIPVRHS